MALKDIPGTGWLIIILLLMVVAWSIFTWVSGHPGISQDLKDVIKHLAGVK
jgi:hypothetical protein